MLTKKVRTAVLVSGGGTNLQAIIDAQCAGIIKSGEVVLVIANNANAYALARAEKAGIRTAVVLKKDCRDSRDFEDRILKILKDEGIELIVLAGFMAILGKEFTDEYPERIINVHPALIPSFCGEGFYGLKVHEAALAKGVKVTGATVHFVNEIPDGGRIISQKAVYIKDGDTPETLQKRVMQEAEWILLPEAVENVSKAIIKQKEARSMDIYKTTDIGELLKGNTYPGRGIICGKSADGKCAAAAYFIMGRSVNSRNRIFAKKDGELFTEPFDASKVEDPSLIIYAAVRTFENNLIVTNGDQTDTICEGLEKGISFNKALEAREFEPDGPNFTPRISAMLTFADNDFTYQMSILKSIDAEGSACARFGFSYPSLSGLGHFIHTYVCDGNPIPTFQGEPERVNIPADMDEFADAVWSALDTDNRISLYVRYTDLQTGEYTDRIINKNK